MQMTVAEHLAASRQAHSRYLQHLPRMIAVPGSVPQASAGDTAEAVKALKEAANHRAQAETIDPTHSDAAWANDAATHPHAYLMLDYLKALSK